MILEICANSFQSAQNAQEAGAHRVELCQELSLGGITPSYGLIRQVKENLSIETYVLIRPRSGNFTYSDDEFETMKKDIQLCKDLGCEGIVSGILNDDDTIDIKRTKELMKCAKPLSFTFHRAFDCVSNPLHTIEQLIELGIDRLLTSGQEQSAENGLELLKALHKIANNRIQLLPGGGINSKNAVLFKSSGFTELHASASKPIEETKSNVYFGDVLQTVSDIETIQSILKCM